MSQTIVILDFGSQYTQVIARRIREAHVYSKVLPFNTSVEKLTKENLQGIILSGGPSSVFEKDAPLPDSKIFELGVPILGICYGIQLMGYLLGGKVEKSTLREYGHGSLSLIKPGMLFKDLKGIMRVWNSHGDRLSQLPKGFEAIAKTENSDFAAIEDLKHNFHGIQFHPEVAHTENGKKIIENFLFGICKCKGDWVLSNFVEESVRKIRNRVGKDHVILGLSGGVDSSVAAALIHKAISSQLTCIFVDNGLLRLNEGQEVEKLFGKHFHIDLRVIDARKQFLSELKGLVDPEEKRKVIGKVFIDIFQNAVKHLPEVKFLAQGTIYPDVIESVPIGNNPASLIKSHHNVGGLPEKMHLKLLEPLRELFKDEVRLLGEELGLPHDMLWRHPFPGPGLGVRVIGEVKEEYLVTVQRADAILIDEIRKVDLYQKYWQAFCVFLPVKSVGVMGDERTHDHTMAIRVVESTDGMTANWARMPYEVLQKVSSRIINEVPGISRVVYDISSKPPSTIEWE